MGLDMYLTGCKYLSEINNKRPQEDGFPVEARHLALGYWHKHPDLHGFIVETFADGKDDCQDIDLDDGDVQQILDAVEADTLPHTQGFFFGTSSPEDKQPTLDILHAALAWMKQEEKGVYRSLIYRASW